jgi:septal ring factor EnvC (AmiA/AmiB activator)
MVTAVSESSATSHTFSSNNKNELIPSATSSLSNPETAVKNDTILVPPASKRVRAIPVSISTKQPLRQKISETETKLTQIQHTLLSDQKTLENLECTLESFSDQRDEHSERIEQLRAQILFEEKRLKSLDEEEESVAVTIEELRTKTLNTNEEGVQLQIQLSKYREELFRGFGRKLRSGKESAVASSAGDTCESPEGKPQVE